MKRRSIIAVMVLGLALLFAPATVVKADNNGDQTTIQNGNSGPVGDGWLEGVKTGDVFGVWVPD